jgi:PHP family Zn ribbon phosphoesterase
MGVDSPSTQAVWQNYNLLVGKFGDEYKVLIDAAKEELAKVVDAPIAEAIVKVRDGLINVIPGYDGVYGRLNLSADALAVKPKRSAEKKVQQLNMADFL